MSGLSPLSGSQDVSLECKQHDSPKIKYDPAAKIMARSREACWHKTFTLRTGSAIFRPGRVTLQAVGCASIDDFAFPFTATSELKMENGN